MACPSMGMSSFDGDDLEGSVLRVAPLPLPTRGVHDRRAAGLTAVADDAFEIKRLDGLRPVPPPTRRRTGEQPAVGSRAAAAMRSQPVRDTPHRRPAASWVVRHIAGLVVVDAVLAGLTSLVAARALPAFSSAAVTAVVVLVSMAAWPAAQGAVGSYAERRLGPGLEEYRRVVLAGLVAVALAGALAPLHLVWDRLLATAVPLTVLTLLGRTVQRQRLYRARRRGLKSKRVVLVGRDVAVIDLTLRLRRDVTAGLQVIGACVPRPRQSSALVGHGVPVLGDLASVVRVLEETRADAVVVTSASETAGQYLRELAWHLEGSNVELLTSSGLIEVAPHRMTVRPTTSVPLIRVQEPEFRGRRRFLKASIDRCVAALLLVGTAPLLLGIALTIRLTSPGPALYRHRRIGKGNVEFDLLKFRSMVTGADSRIDSLMARNEGNEVQFKMRRDPRVTPVGRLLRRSSLDELPQLINVLKGEMSLVGPRPHVAREVAQYGPDMHRRLLVKPGISGLWQVSGRSDLDWDESVELDVRYVENWSTGLDLWILWRTFRAVLRGSGAY